MIIFIVKAVAVAAQCCVASRRILATCWCFWTLLAPSKQAATTTLLWQERCPVLYHPYGLVIELF